MARLYPDSAVGGNVSARRKPSTAKTMDLSMRAITLCCIDNRRNTERNNVPSAKQDRETFRFGIFAAPGSHRAGQ